MLPDEVRKAVEEVNRSLHAIYMPSAPVHESLQAIRAHLLAREAEVERLQDSVNALGLQGAEFMDRCERAEALLREAHPFVPITYSSSGQPQLHACITAHLSENSRG